MGFFGKILEKLGLKKEEKPAEPAKTAAPTVKPMPAPAAQAKPAVAQAKPAAAQPKPAASFDPLSSFPTAKPGTPAPTAVPEVDVVKHLEKLSVGSNLDWKVSIVDLLKLLDLDSSREARNGTWLPRRSDERLSQNERLASQDRLEEDR
jgi:hypothetical protein